MPSLGRRNVLTATALGFISLSGCLSNSGDEIPTSSIRPDTDPAVIPSSLECDDDSFERLNQPFNEDDLVWGDLSAPNITLRVSDTGFALGEKVTVTLTNDGRSTIETGHKSKYSIQLRTEEGWQDVRGARGGVVIRYPDNAVQHDPPEGFEWTFEFSEDGLTDGYDSMAVCPSLQPGRYRFVYWGVSDDAVGVAFDIE